MSYCKKPCNSNNMDVNVTLYMFTNVVKVHRYHSEHCKYSLMHDIVHFNNGQTDRHLTIINIIY